MLPNLIQSKPLTNIIQTVVAQTISTEGALDNTIVQ